MKGVKVKYHEGIPFRYRPGTTDERVFTEVVERAGYRRPSAGFEVEPGERWLDLGANVGAFGIYCKLRGAEAVCYEPEPGCYELLVRNVPWFTTIQSAVTTYETDYIPFHTGKDGTNHSRGSVFNVRTLKPSGEVPNTFVGSLCGRYDGIKMDVEGSEFDILDQGLLPWSNKLVLEYHSSRDPSAEGLARRIEYLKSIYAGIAYPPEYDRKIAEGGTAKTFFDRLIFCWGRK